MVFDPGLNKYKSVGGKPGTYYLLRLIKIYKFTKE